MKKMLTLALALVMILSLAAPVFAADTPVTELSIKDVSTYTGTRQYVAYRVLNASVDGLNFAYSLNDKYTDVLASVLNLTFGAAATQSDKQNAIVGAIKAIGSDVDKIRAFADALYKEIQAKGLTPEVPGAGKTWDGSALKVAQGYYLIVDVTDLEDESYSNSLVMVDTVGDVKVEVENKPDIPDTDKKVDDENDSLINPSNLSEDEISLQDSADYDIGDEVPYTIGIDLPNNVSQYKYDSIVLQDTASVGLTYLPDTFKLTINEVEKVIAPKGTVTTAEGKNVDFWYEIEALQDGSNALYVYPRYEYETYELNTATTDVLDDLVVNQADKTNGGDLKKVFANDTTLGSINNAEIVFTYKCLLNEHAVTKNYNEYSLKYSNNPYDDGFGETIPDVTIVLTYNAIFNKVDTDKTPLEGADFTLFKFIAKQPKDALTEETAKTLTGPDGEAYVYNETANAWGYFEEVTRKTKSGDDSATTEDESTTFTFSGLDDGIYRLEETTVPAGFNGIDPIEFRIEAGHVTIVNNSNDNVLTDLTATSTAAGALRIHGDTAIGTLETDIENRSGTELPNTGGMGTTLFYVFGGLMVCGAAVLLVTKKRMAA